MKNNTCGSLHPIPDLEIEKIKRSACLSTDIETLPHEFPRKIFELGIDWLTNFIMKHHTELGRRGEVCPFAKSAHFGGSLVFCLWNAEELSFESFLLILKKLPSLYYRISASPPLKSKLFSVCVFVTGLKEDQYFRYIDEAHSLTKPIFMEAGLMIGEFHPASKTEGVRSKAFRPMRSPQPLFVVRAITPHDALFIDRDAYPNEVRLRELLSYKSWVGEALPNDDLLKVETRIAALRAAMAKEQ